MADAKTSDLTALLGADVADTDLFPIVDVSAGASGSKKITAAETRLALTKLTTKGDVLGYSTVPGRLGVGSDGQVLTADTASTFGFKWAAGGSVTAAAVNAALVGANLAVAANYASLGAETYSQPTFTPAHDKWQVADDMAFVGNVPTYVATGAGGYIYQAPGDLATALVPGSFYRFSWTLQNVTAGDLVATVSNDNVYGTIAVANGTSYLDFLFSGAESPYPSIAGTTGGFEVVSISLKAARGGVATTGALVAGYVNGMKIGAGGGDIATNTAVGVSALLVNTTGYSSVAVGANALGANTTGAGNTAVGWGALQANMTGDNNDAFGPLALSENTTGSQNASFGSDSMKNNTTGHHNVGVGMHALVDNVTGHHNIGIGFDAGNGEPLQSGNHHNIIIGPDIILPVDVADGQMTIGNLIYGTGLGATGKAVSTGKVGIRVAAPAYDLDVLGSTRAADFIVGSTSIKPLRGVTGAISGALTLGAVNTGTATVTGARVGMAATATPTTYPGNLVLWSCYVSADDTVTVVETGLGVATPTSTTYQVAVFR